MNMKNEEATIRVIWISDKLPEDDDYKLVKLSKLVPEYKLTMPRYQVARWTKDGWSDCFGNEITDVISWSPLEVYPE